MGTGAERAWSKPCPAQDAVRPSLISGGVVQLCRCMLVVPSVLSNRHFPLSHLRCKLKEADGEKIPPR